VPRECGPRALQTRGRLSRVVDERVAVIHDPV
jgi:hypothetical protein